MKEQGLDNLRQNAVTVLAIESLRSRNLRRHGSAVGRERAEHARSQHGFGLSKGLLEKRKALQMMGPVRKTPEKRF